MRESVVFYKSFYEAIKELPTEQQAHLYNAVFQYQFDGEEPELENGIEQAMWKIIKPLIMANNERFENGKKGGRPKKEKPEVIETKTIGFENENHRLSKSDENENLMSNELCVMSNVVMSNVVVGEKATTTKSEVWDFYLNNINSSPVESEINTIASYEKELPSDLIIYAMQRAVEQKKRYLGYIKGILNNWIAKGITTLAEAKDEKKKRRS